MHQPKIKIEEYGTGHFAIWMEAHGAIADVSIPPSLDTATALRLIAQIVRREAERIERGAAPLLKREGTNGVQVDGWWV